MWCVLLELIVACCCWRTQVIVVVLLDVNNDETDFGG
jgi:hypothetical protein